MEIRIGGVNLINLLTPLILIEIVLNLRSCCLEWIPFCRSLVLRQSFRLQSFPKLLVLLVPIVLMIAIQQHQFLFYLEYFQRAPPFCQHPEAFRQLQRKLLFQLFVECQLHAHSGTTLWPFLPLHTLIRQRH